MAFNNSECGPIFHGRQNVDRSNSHAWGNSRAITTGFQSITWVQPVWNKTVFLFYPDTNRVETSSTKAKHYRKVCFHCSTFLVEFSENESLPSSHLLLGSRRITMRKYEKGKDVQSLECHQYFQFTYPSLQGNSWVLFCPSLVLHWICLENFPSMLHRKNCLNSTPPGARVLVENYF